jgi:uncharacterized protein YndB with AHSA1/START domain
METAVSVPDRIEKQILIRAPRSRVWRALTDAEEFSAWFGVRLQGIPRSGSRSRARLPTPATST